MLDTELAWAAGIVDGEGCIHLRRRFRPERRERTISYALILAVKMSHKPTIEKLHTLFGGSFRPENKAYQPHYKQMWTFEASGETCQAILLAILPYLVTKLDEAKLALEYRQLGYVKFPKGGCPPELFSARTVLYEKLKQAKKYAYANT